MRSLIHLFLCLAATVAHAKEVPWGALAGRSDAILHTPDLADWMRRFHAAFGETLRRPAVEKQLPDRDAFEKRFGFDPFGPPPADLKAGPATFAFNLQAPTEAILPGQPPQPGAEPDLSACVEREQAQLWVAAAIPGRTLDRGLKDCMTVRLSTVGERTVLDLDQSATSGGLGLLAPLFPRDPDETWLTAVGANAKGVVRVRTAPAARGALGPLFGSLPESLVPIFKAHYGDEFVLVWRDELELLVRLREPAKAKAALVALGSNWGGLRGEKPFWGASEVPPVPLGHTVVRGDYLVIARSKPQAPSGRYGLPARLLARAPKALAVVDIPLAGLEFGKLLSRLPSQAPTLDMQVVKGALENVERLSVAVGVAEGRFWLRFRALGAASAEAAAPLEKAPPAR